MQDRIRKVLSEVLDLKPSEINETTSPKTVEEWDSLKHMDIVFALEEEFGIQFLDDEIAEMVSYGEIVRIVSTKPASS
ncbi:MAG: acyl carrier protein [Desulfomonile tiedjei]|nr:acyl carrier protein [Desulfomonile tiedjei]